MKTCLALSFAFLAACSSSDKTDIADATVNGQTIHVFREGPEPAAGVSTTIVFKPMDGATPDAIMGWVGLQDTADSLKVAAVYDADDGDFDDDITVQSPLPAGSKIWFSVTTADHTETSSVDIK